MAIKQTGKKIHKTMQGKPVDMDLLRKRNELTPAVGNARVNARGDELGAGGKIVRKREEVLADYYRDNPKKVPDINKSAVQSTETSIEKVSNDEWMEDAEGNFVKKDK
jgi:hypothetical protein